MKSNTLYYKFVLVLFLVCAPNLLAISTERKHRHRHQHEKLMENVQDLKVENQSKTGKLDKKHFKIEFKLSLSAAQFASSISGDNSLKTMYTTLQTEAKAGSGDKEQGSKAGLLTKIDEVGVKWTVTGAYTDGDEAEQADEVDVSLLDQSHCAQDDCGSPSENRRPKRSFSGFGLMGDDEDWSKESEDASTPLIGKKDEDYRFKWSSALTVVFPKLELIKALLTLALAYLIRKIIKTLLIEVAKEVAAAVVAAVLPVAGWVLFVGKLIDWIYKVSKLKVSITKEVKNTLFKKHSIYTFEVSYPLSFVPGLSIGMALTMSLRKGKKFIADICVKSIELNSKVKQFMDPITTFAGQLVTFVLEKIKTQWNKWYSDYKATRYQRLDDEETIKELTFQERGASRKLFKHRKSKKRMSKA